MAGLITHMVVIREMLKLLPAGSIANHGLFYLGSLAPDAVHAREGYIRAYKKHTHFRDDIPDCDFENPKNYVKYQKRLVDFIVENNHREDELFDLYLGYVVHILVDELFITSVRKEFCITMEELGIAQQDQEFFDRILKDMNRNDLLLTKNYEGMKEIQKELEQAIVYPIKDYIGTPELEISRKWLLSHHFYEKQELLQPVYISYQRMLDFIQIAAKEIIDRLSGNGVLPRML